MQIRFSVHSPNGGVKEVARIRERVVQAEHTASRRSGA